MDGNLNLSLVQPRGMDGVLDEEMQEQQRGLDGVSDEEMQE
jgi:hypothetical protein